MLRSDFPDRVRRYAGRLDLPCGEFLNLSGEWAHYLRGAGQGAPVVLLHGLMEWAITWEAILDNLAGRPWWAPDLRGFGWNQKTGLGAYDLTAQATHVQHLLDAWGLEQVTLVGHSMGGEIALRLALMAPARVRSLVLVDSAGYVSGRAVAVERMLRWPRWLVHAVMGALLRRRTYAARALQGVYHDPRRIPERAVRGYHAPSRLPGTAATLRAVLRDADFGAWADRYGEIDHPALLIWGAQDTVTPLAHGERLARVLPRAELHVIGDAHHLPHEETPEQVRPLLERWLMDPAH